MVAYLLYFYLAFWPIMPLIGGWKLGGAPAISLARATLLLLFAMISLRAFLKKERFILGGSFCWFCLYLVWCFLNSYINPTDSRVQQFQSIVDTLFLPYLSYLVITNMKGRLNYRAAVAAFITSGLIIAVSGIAEWVAGRNLIGPDTAGATMFRPNGPFNDGLAYAASLASYIPFIYYFVKKRCLGRYAGLLCGAFLSFGSLINFSLGSTLSILVVIMILQTSGSFARLIGRGLAFGTCGGMGLYLLSGVIRSSRTYQARMHDTSTVAGRWAMYRHEVNIVLDAPFTGVGFGNYMKTHLLDPHNSYLLVLIEYGLLGFVFFIGFFGAILLKNIRKASRRGDGVMLRAKISDLFLVAFLANTVTLLHEAPFVCGLMIAMAMIDRHFSDISAVEAARSGTGRMRGRAAARANGIAPLGAVRVGAGP